MRECFAADVTLWSAATLTPLLPSTNFEKLRQVAAEQSADTSAHSKLFTRFRGGDDQFSNAWDDN